MSRILQLKTSLFDHGSKQGISTLLSDELVRGLQAGTPSASLVVRDFATEPVPYLDNAWLQALSTPAADRSAEQHSKVAYSDRLIAELQAADVVVIGVPMYNQSVPSMLKSWIDHVARAGVTFKYTDKGAVGLLGDKKVYLVYSFGGRYEEGVTEFVRPFMRNILGLMGLRDIEHIVADGVNMGEVMRAEGLQKARDQINAVVSGPVVSGLVVSGPVVSGPVVSEAVAA